MTIVVLFHLCQLLMFLNWVYYIKQSRAINILLSFILSGIFFQASSMIGDRCLLFQCKNRRRFDQVLNVEKLELQYPNINFALYFLHCLKWKEVNEKNKMRNKMVVDKVHLFCISTNQVSNHDDWASSNFYLKRPVLFCRLLD